MDTWTLGHLDTWTLVHLDTWTLGQCTLGHIGPLDPTRTGHLGTWTLGHSDTCTLDRSRVQVYKCPSVHVSECPFPQESKGPRIQCRAQVQASKDECSKDPMAMPRLSNGSIVQWATEYVVNGVVVLFILVPSQF